MSPPLFFWLDIIALGASALIAAVLVLMALGTGPKRVLNRAFGIFVLAEATWAVSGLSLRLSLWFEVGIPSLLSELDALALTLMGPFLLMLTVCYVGRRTRWTDLIVILGLAATGLFAIPLFRHQLVYNPRLGAGGTTHLDLSPWGFLVALLPTLYFGLSLALFWQERHRTGEPYLALSVLILLLGFVAGGIIDVPLPIMSIVNLLSISTLGYGVISRQLFNPLRELTADLERKVEERTQELGRAYAQVEKRVEERTSELKQEIVERQLVEKALRESEERYRALVTQAPLGVITGDRAGNITHVNPAAFHILGSPGEKATGQFNLLTMPSLIEAGIATDIRRCIEDAMQITGEYSYRSYWSKDCIMRLHLTPLRDESESVGGVLILIEDVTEQRQLEEQLVQSAKLVSIGELAAGVAHEINNPINGIINYAQLLLNKTPIADEAGPDGHETRQKRKWLQGILREGDRVAHIVRGLLTFARVEKEAHSLAHVPDILEATLTLTNQQLQKDGISLEIEEQPDLPQIKCRSQRIQQVFLNLISNARSALNDGYPDRDQNKRLIVRVGQVEKSGQPYVRTTFCDYGVGIPAHTLPHIFTPFYTTKRPGEGTGLGLSVSYGIVQNHHGDIQVESIEGEHTIFRVDLPVDPEWEDMV